jgi:tRNA-Thr(GGU) m(6)t(6)A37 methyltransferase TsaA
VRGDDALRVHPRGDQTRAKQGVFNTRSPDRPNPIGLHRVRVVAIQGRRMRVKNLEALHGTPVLDVKPVLGDIAARGRYFSTKRSPAEAQVCFTSSTVPL